MTRNNWLDFGAASGRHADPTILKKLLPLQDSPSVRILRDQLPWLRWVSPEIQFSKAQSAADP